MVSPENSQTVSSIAINDGNGNTSTTNYTYSGGLYDATDREFRGFQYVKATDAAGTTSEATFLQDATYKGLLYYKVIKSASGNKYSETYNNYSVTSPATGVSFPYLFWQDNRQYDGTPTARRNIITFVYDAYGNVKRKYNDGDHDDAADDIDENIEYNYDNANWIMSYPRRAYILDGTGVKKSETSYTYYDNTWNLKTEKKWSNGATDPVITYEYDSYGNRTAVIDPKKNRTTIAYETTTQTYPVTITNTLGHTATKTWGTGWGRSYLFF